jgi:hypothetical protein
MNANFFDIHSAADYIGPGAIEVPFYQTEITDIVRRRGIFGQRIKQVPATGHPSRFFEETAIPNPGMSGFVNPRAIVAPTVSPTRVERSVPLKAIVAQINYNLFDIELGNQQKQFAYLQAKDLVDTVEGVLNTHDVALWNGNDTSLATPTPNTSARSARSWRMGTPRRSALHPVLWMGLNRRSPRWWPIAISGFVRLRSMRIQCCST